MDNTQMLLIIIAILGGSCIIAGGLFFGLQSNVEGDNLTSNNTTSVTLVNDSNSSNNISNVSKSSKDKEYRPAVDSKGTTREEADYYGYKYTSKHGGNYIGTNDHWDEEAQVYHD